MRHTMCLCLAAVCLVLTACGEEQGTQSQAQYVNESLRGQTAQRILTAEAGDKAAFDELVGMPPVDWNASVYRPENGSSRSENRFGSSDLCAAVGEAVTIEKILYNPDAHTVTYLEQHPESAYPQMVAGAKKLYEALRTPSLKGECSSLGGSSRATADPVEMASLLSRLLTGARATPEQAGFTPADVRDAELAALELDAAKIH